MITHNSLRWSLKTSYTSEVFVTRSCLSNIYKSMAKLHASTEFARVLLNWRVWKTKLQSALLEHLPAYRSTAHSGRGTSPSVLLQGRRTRTRLNVAGLRIRSAVTEAAPYLISSSRSRKHSQDTSVLRSLNSSRLALLSEDAKGVDPIILRR